MTTIITSVGYPAAGKSVIADWMEDAGVPVVSMGNRLRERFEQQDKQELMNKLGTSNASSLLGKWATRQREKHGSDIVAKWTAEHIKDNIQSDTVFVDGLRSNEELSRFEERFDSVHVIFVDADKSIRLERIRNRGREGESEFTMQDLEERDKREESWGLKQVIPKSDFTIKNESSIEHFHDRISEVFQNITNDT